MNNQRLLFGAAWLASLVLVYFIASGSETAKTPAGAADGTAGANAGGAIGDASRNQDSASRDRTMRRSMDQMEEVGKKEKANVTQLIAQARLQIGGMGMMNMRGMLRAMAPLAELDDAQIQEALGEVERTVKEPQQKMMLYSLLLTQWAETDGKAALAYADEKMGPQSGLNMGLRGSILGAWAGRDPDAAWAWFQAQNKDGASDPMNGFTTTMLFSSLAANNLDSAFQRLDTLDESSRAMALSGIANSAGDAAARARLLERAATLPAEQRAVIYQSVASRSVMMDPEGTVKWIHSLPPEEQKPVRDSASSVLMIANAALGAELMMEGVEEKDKPQAYLRVVGHWANRDPRAAGEWLMKQPQGPELDHARSSYASTVAQKDPAAAMDWAKSVQAEDMRTNSVQQVYSQWRAKDAAAADAALDASGLAEEKIKQFRAAPVSKPPSRAFGGFGF